MFVISWNVTKYFCRRCYLAGQVRAKSDDSAHNITNLVGRFFCMISELNVPTSPKHQFMWKSVHSCWILCIFGLDVYSCVNNCILEVCISGGMCKMKPFYPLPRLLSLLLFSPIWVMQTWPSKEMLLMWHFKAQCFRTNPANLGFKRPRSQYLLLAASCTLLYTSV